MGLWLDGLDLLETEPQQVCLPGALPRRGGERGELVLGLAEAGVDPDVRRTELADLDATEAVEGVALRLRPEEAVLV